MVEDAAERSSDPVAPGIREAVVREPLRRGVERLAQEGVERRAVRDARRIARLGKGPPRAEAGRDRLRAELLEEQQPLREGLRSEERARAASGRDVATPTAPAA